MILVFPLLLVVATFLTLRRGEERGFGSDGSSWRWFAAWSAAGAAMTFSFLTGLSIGLFVLPLAAALLLWVASRAPHLPDVLGFAAGMGGVLLLVAFLNRAGTGADSVSSLLAGLSIYGCALLAYALLRRRIRAST